MSADIEALVIKISADTASMQASMKSAVDSMKSSTDQMNKSLEKFSGDGEKHLGVFETAMGAMAGVVGGELVIGAFEKLGEAAEFLWDSIIVDGVKAASATQAALHGLSQAMANAGNSTDGTTQSMAQFVDQIEKTSMFSDVAAAKSATLLENITRLDADGLQKATQASADLAAALGIDLESASSLVGKAIEGNTGALGRYGIKLDTSTDKTQQFANVVDVLNERFGGSARAQLDTFQGAVHSLEVTWEDFTKTIGNAIINNKAVINVIAEVGQIFRELGGNVDENKQGMAEFVALAVVKLTQFGVAVGDVAKFIQPVLNQIIADFENVGEGIGAVASAVASAAHGDFKSGMEAIKESMDDADKRNRSAAETPFLDGRIAKLKDVQAAAEDGLEEVRDGNIDAEEPVRKVAGAIDQQTAALTAAQQVAKDYADKIVKSSTDIQAGYEAEVEALKAGLEDKSLSESAYYDQRMELLQNAQAQEDAMLQQGLALSQLTQEQKNQAELSLALKHDADMKKLTADRTKADKAQNDLRLQQGSQFFGNLATLSRTGNKTLGEIGKAAAIAQATIDGIAGVQKALASAPPPFNFALAAAVGVAAAVNVAKIVSTPLASGIDEVPGIGNRDSFPAMLMPGERVVPKDTNQDLKAFLAQGGGGGPVINLNITFNESFLQDTREIGAKIVEVINDASAATGVKLLKGSVAA